MTPEPMDIVNRLRMYADDLHSAGGFNGYATAMSLAADEIVRLRDYAEIKKHKPAYSMVDPNEGVRNAGNSEEVPTERNTEKQDDVR